MKCDEAYSLFESLIEAAREALFDQTLNFPFKSWQKKDSTLVTQCDQRIDNELTELIREKGLFVVSEEGEHSLEVVKSGNYVTLDPIDGTFGYLDYLDSISTISDFEKIDLGPLYDFGLLVGVVEQTQPVFGLAYNYITHETIIVDGVNPKNLVWKNRTRFYNQKSAAYLSSRASSELEIKISKIPDISIIKQATMGWKSLYTILQPHERAIMVRETIHTGLWDILPGAVAARCFGAELELEFNKYVQLPNQGLVIKRGNWQGIEI